MKRVNDWHTRKKKRKFLLWWEQNSANHENTNNIFTYNQIKSSCCTRQIEIPIRTSISVHKLRIKDNWRFISLLFLVLFFFVCVCSIYEYFVVCYYINVVIYISTKHQNCIKLPRTKLQRTLKRTRRKHIVIEYGGWCDRIDQNERQ